MQLTSGQLYSQRNKASSVYKPDFIVPLTAWPDSHFGYWAQPATPASPPGAPAACFSCPPVADPASCEPHRAPPPSSLPWRRFSSVSSHNPVYSLGCSHITFLTSSRIRPRAAPSEYSRPPVERKVRLPLLGPKARVRPQLPLAVRRLGRDRTRLLKTATYSSCKTQLNEPPLGALPRLPG